MPAQYYMVNANNNLFVKYPSSMNMDHIKAADNIKKLGTAGITPRLAPTEVEEKTIFVNSAPGAIFEIEQNQLINEDNKNIIATNTYVPPKKVPNQKLGSLKITLATRNMVNSAFTFWIRILGCLKGTTLQHHSVNTAVDFMRAERAKHSTPHAPTVQGGIKDLNAQTEMAPGNASTARDHIKPHLTSVPRE